MVSHNRVELLSPGCKPGVLPLDEWDMVRRPGLEPGSFGLKGRCSIAIELATHVAGKAGLRGASLHRALRTVAKATLRIAPGNAVRTSIRHINSVLTYRMVHFPITGLDEWI